LALSFLGCASADFIHHCEPTTAAKVLEVSPSGGEIDLFSRGAAVGLQVLKDKKANPSTSWPINALASVKDEEIAFGFPANRH
jgi:hypothetical protein